MLALAGGAAMAGKGKGEISSNRPSGIDAAMKVASTAAANNAAADVAVDAAPAITGLQEGNTRLKRDGMGPMESVIAKRKIPGYGTAVAPPGILNPYRAPRGPGPRRFSKGGSVKKAKVTGIAKRGFGRALMKGKK